jgi:thiamine biosynthesis protein ThiS
MNLIINGEDRNFDSGLTITSLLERLGMKPDRVAIELNRELLPRERWPSTRLSEGDKLEIVHFVGGGFDSLIPETRHSDLRPCSEAGR